MPITLEKRLILEEYEDLPIPEEDIPGMMRLRRVISVGKTGRRTFSKKGSYILPSNTFIKDDSCLQLEDAK